MRALRGWGEVMTDFEQKVLEELSALKVQMHQLMGVGQPGRLHLLEERVQCHEQNMQRMKGLVAAYSGALAVVQIMVSYMGGKHN